MHLAYEERCVTTDPSGRDASQLYVLVINAVCKGLGGLANCLHLLLLFCVVSDEEGTSAVSLGAVGRW